MIANAGGVKIVDQANNREYRLQPGGQNLPRGDYRIDVTEALAGLDFQVNKFELKRGKEVRLSARFVAKGEGQIVDGVLTANERKQAKERLESLREIADLKERLYQTGGVAFEQLLSANNDVARAELYLSESDADRVKAHERIVALGQALVEYRDVQFQVGTAIQVDVLKAKADLLQAQSDLNRAKARTAQASSLATNASNEHGSFYHSKVPLQATPQAASNASKEPGPMYRGKPASFCLEQLKDADLKFQVEALIGLGKMARQNEELIPVLASEG